MRCVVMILIMIAARVTVGEECHTFTDKKGHSVSARVTGYDSKSGKIQIEAWVNPPASLGDALKVTGNSPEKAALFLNPLFLKISIAKEGSDWEKMSGEEREEKKTSHLMKLENMSDTEFNGLRVEYCIYRDQFREGGEQILTDVYSKQIGTLEPFGTNEVETARKLNFKIPGFLSEVSGGCFRVYLPVVGGRDVMREIRFPETLSKEKYPWKGSEENDASKPGATAHRHSAEASTKSK